jgi:hypothetical protein
MFRNILLATASVFALAAVGCSDPEPQTDPEAVVVTGVTVSPSTLTIYIGDAPVTLQAEIVPSNADNKAVTWSGDNAYVATVDPKTGVVTAVGPGKATITAATGDGDFEGTCVVTVKDHGDDIVYEFVREGVETTLNDQGEQIGRIAWGLTADGILALSGEGKMKSYFEDLTLETFATDAPWFALDVTSVVIQKGITSIGQLAFAGMEGIEKVTIGRDVEEIGIGAFAFCSELEEVVVGRSVENVRQMAFFECSSLKGIEFPDALESIYNQAFEGCTSLATVTVGNQLGGIGAKAFEMCTALTGIELPDTVAAIGDRAFFGCRSLANATLGSGLLYLGTGQEIVGGVFESCTSLKSIVIPDGVPTIHNGAFYACSALTEVVIGEGVTLIGGNAFDSCTSLTSITIPAAMELIDLYAFRNCPALANVTVMGETPPDLYQDYESNNYLSFTRTDDVLHVPAGSVADYEASRDWSEAFGDIVEQ